MQQLKNVIRRSNVPTNPKNNMNAADDFLNILLVAHVIALAMKHFKMQSINDTPVLKRARFIVRCKHNTKAKNVSCNT